MTDGNDLDYLEHVRELTKCMEGGMEPASYPWTTAYPDLASNNTRGVPWVPQTSPHPWDGYLTGPENELAMAAAQAMARGEHIGISPLVVYGPSGVGKSRLLSGLVTEWVHRQPDSRVVSLDAQTFIAACMEATAKAGRMGWSSLHTQFRSAHLFVLEDLEGLERGPIAWDEFVHTLDVLEATGASMAFSVRTPPATWPLSIWPRRLVARLVNGLTAPITAPGLTSRRRYVLHHAALQGIILQAEAVETLAQAADGYRTLEGWLFRLAIECRLAHRPGTEGNTRDIGLSIPESREFPSLQPMPLDPRTVVTILADETQLAESPVSINVITDVVAAQFGIRPGVLRGSSRRASIVRVRHVAMYLARKFTSLSFVAIGANFGNRDAATVRHACKTTSQRMRADPILAAVITRLEGRWSRYNP